MKYITVPIEASNLPPGNFWEADGACWKYVHEPRDKRGYRMMPMNLKAFGKGEPEGPMTDFYLPTKQQFAAQGIGK